MREATANPGVSGCVASKSFLVLIASANHNNPGIARLDIQFRQELRQKIT
jgi:hypothetical protein